MSNTPNPEWSKAMHEKRRSSAVEPHKDKRTKRQRSREAAKRTAIRDSDSRFFVWAGMLAP